MDLASRERKREYNNRWRRNNPELALRQQRKHYLVKKYGITLEQFDVMLVEQGGVCAICAGGPRPWPNLVVDHDHGTGKVRGLLCHKCNAGLGQFRDDPNLVRRALEYMGRIC